MLARMYVKIEITDKGHEMYSTSRTITPSIGHCPRKNYDPFIPKNPNSSPKCHDHAPLLHPHLLIPNKGYPTPPRSFGGESKNIYKKALSPSRTSAYLELDNARAFLQLPQVRSCSYVPNPAGCCPDRRGCVWHNVLRSP